MTKGADTFSEIDSRLYEATPVKEVASPIDSTRQVLPQLFGLGGQTEPTQAQTGGEARRGREGLSRFESLARDLLHELNAMKNDMRNLSVKHEKQVEVDAVHESYKKMYQREASRVVVAVPRNTSA